VHLDVAHNLLRDAGAEELSRGLLGSHARRLRHLSVRGNDISSVGIAAVCAAAPLSPALSSIDVSQNPLKKTGALMVISLVTSCDMRSILLADTLAEIDVVVGFASALMSSSSKLEVCDLENPRILTLQEEHTMHLGQMLRTNTFLRELHVGKHRIRSDGMRQLAHFLMENKTLRILDLRCNEIGSDGAVFLGDLLRQDCQLTHLDLSGNRIGEKDNLEGVTAIADALTSNRMLVHLDLNHNSLCGGALQILGRFVDQNSTLESLALFHNQWNQTSACKFHQILGDRARILPLSADFLTSEVDLRIDVCWMRDFQPKS